MFTSPPAMRFPVKEEIDLKDVDIWRVWLLNDIYCLRGQVEVLCKRKKKMTGSRPRIMNREAWIR
jgi:hypothetical protein